MPDSSRQPCSDQLTTLHLMHFWEKANFAGFLIGGIFYGVVILLFFRCMGALLNPVNQAREGIRRGLVTYTMAMFSFVTIFTATNLDIQSNSYIDNREFPGVCVLPLGPLRYQSLTYSGAIVVCRSLMFLLNSWLADGLLLYRFHVIYSMNHWITAFPCLMYLASIVMGIMLVYQTSQPDSSLWSPGAISFGLPYFSISVSLNILLTIMIVARLTLHIISIRNSMGTPVVASGLYHAIKAVVIMLVESSALYAVSSLLFIAPWGARSHLADVFWPILAETQVIASLLIVWRFADRSTLTNNTAISWNTGPYSVGSQGGSMGGGGSLPDGYPMNSMNPCGKTSGMLVVGVETTVDVHRDGV